MAWGLIDLLAGPSYGLSEGLVAHERYRLREMINRLRIVSNPVPLLRSWLPKRADRIHLSCANNDLRDLAQDARIVRSGISDPRSGMSAGLELECYVQMPDLPELKAEYLLVPSVRRNVYLHVSPRQLLKVPLILVAADLADHNGARENSQAEKLLKEALWP